MADYLDGIKKQIAEVKFLIHDLRVDRFINEVIHFHATLNTDLEIYGMGQLQARHNDDLQQLKRKALHLRKSFKRYYNAVRGYAPDQTVLSNGRAYIEAIFDVCGLILDPSWGAIDEVVAFLPNECRTLRSRSHYRNCIRWIDGVRTRIEHFQAEQERRDISERFNIAEDIRDYTRNRLYGYVTETSRARVELLLDRLDSAVIKGNRYRFRRMLFNLIMNSVDAMAHQKLGILNISAVIEGDRVALRVRDNGSGMTAEKIGQLLRDKKSLDGEVHSLGFVFVRQTVAQFDGELVVESELGKGTTITIRLPHLAEERLVLSPGRKTGVPEESASPERIEVTRVGSLDAATSGSIGDLARTEVVSDLNRHSNCGQLIYLEYEKCEADFPGSIFAMGVDADDKIDFFVHQPYERLWNITHEDLSPMFFQATVRGRLEEDDEKRTVLILKPPQDVNEYFEFRGVPAKERELGSFVTMVHDEYVRIARKLIATGLPGEINVYVAGLQKFFLSSEELLKAEPFALEILAKETLSREAPQDS